MVMTVVTLVTKATAEMFSSGRLMRFTYEHGPLESRIGGWLGFLLDECTRVAGIWVSD